MPISADATCREVLAQIVHDPEYKKLARLPLVSWEQVAVLLGAYTVFAASTIAWLYGAWPLLAMIIVNGVAVYASFTPLHDATHRAVSRNWFLNGLIGTISAQLILPGATTRLYRDLHLTHHRFEGDKLLDPDEAFTSAPRWALGFILPFIDFYWIYWYVRYGRSVLPNRFALEISVFAALNLGFFAVMLSSPYWLEFLLAYMIPQRLGIFLVAYFFAHIQHPEGVTFEDQPFQATVYIPANWLERFFMLGQTDHHIHHLLPNIPHYRYNRVWELGNRVLEKHDIPRGSYLGNLGRPPEREDPPGPLRALVTETRDIAQDIRQFSLEPAPGETFPSFDAGAHIALHLPSGALRHYSLCGDPAEPGRYRIAIKRDAEGRGGSVEAHEALRAGADVMISAPKNNFLLYERGARYILIAGGVGATPMFAMAHRLQRLGKFFTLHLCSRDAASAPFGAELANLPFAARIKSHLDASPGVSSLDPRTAIGPYDKGALLYLCGPAGFMRWLTAEATALGWPQEAILSENFSAPMEGVAQNKPFEVELARSGHRFTVPADKAIIDMLPNLGVPVKTSCMQGVCGTCVTRVLEGEIEHRDSTLTETERASNGLMCLCISRARNGGKVVLDL